jgi:hypothetical protein
MESVRRGDIRLEAFHVLIFELGYLPAFCTDEMVMVFAQVAMFIAGRLPIEHIFLSKSIIHPAVHTLTDKGGIIIITPRLQQLHQLIESHVLLGSQKGINDIEPLFDMSYLIVLNESVKIGLFEMVFLGHVITPLIMEYLFH